jgi:hypothetical protein
VLTAASIVVPTGAGLLIAGAVQMLRRRCYPFCLVTVLVAVLPWSPAWPLGLTVGIWAVTVLGRREVMLAFLRDSGGTPPDLADDAEPPGHAAGKLRSWVRSFVGYFVTTTPKTRDEERAIPPRAREH